MAPDRDGVAVDSASSASASASASAATAGQSKRPSLNHRASDQSDSNIAAAAASNNNNNLPHPRPKHQKHHHHVGRMHARVSSSKGLHKQHPHAAANSSKLNLNRKQPSPTDHDQQFPQRPAPHRRATSEVKLPRQSSSSNIPKSLSQSNLKRNRSHVEVSKRAKSSDKLKRSSSGSGIHKSNKSQVHFDLGSDDPDDEWVDASGSNSPYLSRKGSLNSSTHSSFRPADSAVNSRPETPNEPPQPQPSSPDRKTAQHKEYLTTRLLQRTTSSQGAPPKMSSDMAKAGPSRVSPDSTGHDASPQTGSHDDGLTSRFVEVPSSGVTSEGSFYNSAARTGSQRSDDLHRRPHSSMVNNFSRSLEYTPRDTVYPVDSDNSALVPRPARRTGTVGPSAETSRTQQKLNLQRASSSIEPPQTVTAAGGVVGVSPLIGVGDPGHDGGNSRDPRVNKLLERTGMEYLVVRRHQNPIARSLNRLGCLPGMEKTRRIPRTNTASTTAGKRFVDLPVRHVRNVSLPDGRQTIPTRRAASIRTNGAWSSFEGDDMNRLGERLSGSSLLAEEEEDGTTALLRNLWEKPMDLSASTD